MYARDKIIECFNSILDQISVRLADGVYNLDRYRRVLMKIKARGIRIENDDPMMNPDFKQMLRFRKKNQQAFNRTVYPSTQGGGTSTVKRKKRPAGAPGEKDLEKFNANYDDLIASDEEETNFNVNKYMPSNSAGRHHPNRPTDLI